jgi:hypothetical protein
MDYRSGLVYVPLCFRSRMGFVFLMSIVAFDSAFGFLIGNGWQTLTY